MIHFCLLFFLFLIPTIAGHAYVAQNTVSEEWLRIEDEYFIVKYKEGYKSDAELILKYCRYARNVTMKVYPHKLDMKVTVYLYDYKSWKDRPYVIRTDYTKAEIYLLTPSDQPAEYRSQCDNLWYQKNIVHEYVHIPTLRDLHYRSRYKKAPRWFTEGMAEYIAIFRTTPEILERYRLQLKNIEDMVKRGDGYLSLVSEDTYFGGAYILKYMFETYGKDKVAALFKSSAESFAKAVKKELEVTYYEFEANWLKWACKEFNVDPTLYRSSYFKMQEV